jgi:hypothetical protein
MALFISACTDTFLVYKDGYGYFMGSGSKAKYDLICTSGDLEEVLLSSHLNQETKDSLFKYSCSAERSGNKVKQIYASMTVEERKDIKSAFRKNGYMINYMNC